MVKIKIKDLSKNEKISEKEMKKILGGISSVPIPFEAK